MKISHLAALRRGALTLACMIAMGGAAAAAPLFRLVDLGPAGAAESGALDINDHGLATGYADFRDGEVPRQTYGLRTDGLDSGLFSALSAKVTVGYAINNMGDVAGYYSNGRLGDAFGQVGGVATALAPDARFSTATDINDAGVIVGWFSDDEGENGFVYDHGTLTLLPREGGWDSYAKAINSRGDVVGSISGWNGDEAVLWSGGSVIRLGSLGGEGSYANAISDGGVIVGESADADGVSQPFVWADGTMTPLSSFGVSGAATALNARGWIVGRVEDRRGEETAFLHLGGTMFDLNTLVDGGPNSAWRLRSAEAVNSRGQIVGYADVGGALRAYRLDPIDVAAVPEPATWGLMITGFGLAGVWLRRRAPGHVAP